MLVETRQKTKHLESFVHSPQCFNQLRALFYLRSVDGTNSLVTCFICSEHFFQFDSNFETK